MAYGQKREATHWPGAGVEVGGGGRVPLRLLSQVPGMNSGQKLVQ